MHDAATLLVIMAELTAIVAGLRRFGWSAAPTLFGLHLIVAQIVAWLVIHGILGNEMLDLYGGSERQSELHWAILAATGLFALLYALCAATGVRAAQPLAFSLSCRPPPVALALGCALMWSMLFLTIVATIEWSLLWSTDHYLTLTDPAILTHGALSAAALNALPGIGAASAALSATLYAKQSRQHLLAGILLLQAVVTMTWLLSAHSRAAALPPAAFAFTSMITSREKSGFSRIAAAGALVIVALAGALSGRNLGNHGISSLGALPGLVIDFSSWAPILAVNINEGIFAVAAGLGEWRSATTDSISFHVAYIWLSFSPLPSAIDGFAQVLDAQVRLHAFAPMPGYVELAWFGPWSQAAFAALVALTLRLSAKLTEIAPIYGAMTSLLLVACLYLMAAYPVRTALKPLWLSLVISAFIITLTIVRKKGHPQHFVSPARRGS